MGLPTFEAFSFAKNHKKLVKLSARSTCNAMSRNKLIDGCIYFYQILFSEVIHESMPSQQLPVRIELLIGVY